MLTKLARPPLTITHTDSVAPAVTGNPLADNVSQFCPVIRKLSTKRVGSVVDTSRRRTNDDGSVNVAATNASASSSPALVDVTVTLLNIPVSTGMVAAGSPPGQAGFQSVAHGSPAPIAYQSPPNCSQPKG
jgi:hypothetical protein